MSILKWYFYLYRIAALQDFKNLSMQWVMILLTLFSIHNIALAETDLTQYGYANPLSNFVTLSPTGKFLQTPDTGYIRGKHLGMDYKANAEDIIYSICDGTVVESEDYNFHRTYNSPTRDEHNSYWTSRVVVRCTSPSFLVIYGHVNGALDKNDQVQKGAYIARIAPAYSESNIRQSNEDHLHLGVNIKNSIDYSESSLGDWGFGIGPQNASNEDVVNRGFRHPIDFLTNIDNSDNICFFPDIEYSVLKTEVKIAVKKLCNDGIVKGYGDGNFGPNDNIQRAAVAKMIMLTKLVDEKMTSSERDARAKPDLTLEEDYSGQLWAKFQKEINARRETGVPTRVFCDSGKNHIAPPPPPANSSCQPISGHVSENSRHNWFCEYVNTLANIGLVVGYEASCGLEFKPFKTINRAEALIMTLKGLVGIDITNQEKDWFMPTVKCALDVNRNYDTQTHRLFRISKTKFESLQTNNAKLVEFGIQNATRAEVAFLIHRVRELRSDGHSFCSTYGTIVSIND